MGALVDNHVLEDEISECLHAIYQAPDPESAVKYCTQLRNLKAQRVEAENRLFQLESQGLARRQDGGVGVTVPPTGINHE